MKKKYIVKKNMDFERIITSGLRKKNKCFYIYYMKNNLAYNRYGISVGKKLGTAVYRNKYKRRIRVIVDHYKKDCLIGYDYIIILREKAKTSSFSLLKEEYISLINQIIKEN